MASAARRRKRTYNVRLIKATWSYSVQEIAALYGLHKGAVLRWMKGGLQPIDRQRPFLIRGDELARFLAARQARRKRKCASNEFFCFKCRQPRLAHLDQVQFTSEGLSRVRLKANCCVCRTPVNKVQSMKNWGNLRASFRVAQLTGEHLAASAAPSDNSDLEAIA
jgi:hypothetical protein